MNRYPAEWEPQDAVLICWPHAGTDWKPYLEEAEKVFLEISFQVTRREKLVVAAHDESYVRTRLQNHGINMEQVILCPVGSNDTWARDFGPITVLRAGRPLLLDFTFNGWGNKFEARLDNHITEELTVQGAFGDTAREVVNLVLEGGSIESDGRGTLLTTAECLLNPNRNPELTRKQIEAELTDLLGVEHVLWLEHGSLAGDDTDAHIDTLARLCPNDTILYVQCTDPGDEHFPAFRAMEEQLQTFRTAEGNSYRLIPLPWPVARFDSDGERLPATYANFLIINGAVLVPTYNDPANDAGALAAVKKAFPDREIIGIDCSTLIRQHGSLHCVTMQIYKGVLK